MDAAIVTRLAYDALGNLTQRMEAAGRPGEERTTRYEYDALGRQVRVIHPLVAVYDPAADAVTTNGATGLAARRETPAKALETLTFYDVLGNAVANRDVGGALSQKAYDLLGRVSHEVDALGYVTAYTRNAFGDVTTLVRHGAATTLANVNLTLASQAATRQQVDAALAAPGVDHSQDRALLSTYDRMGRLLEKTEPTAFVADFNAAGVAQSGSAGRKTRMVYDAFGQVVQVKTLRDWVADTWATTTRYFDRLGHETASIDALGYLTVREFDAMGNVTRSVEYANAVPSTWTKDSYTLPVSNPDDRVTNFSFDRLNRKLSETRVGVEFSASANGTSARGNLTSTFGYDALGNQVSVTDAQGKVTYTCYDAAGRVLAVAEPARASTASGATLTPLTSFRRDAYGNVVARLEHANGALTANAAGYQAAAADAADRLTLAAYDSFGHATQVRDANGASSYTSYDAWGHAAKQWQGVTGNDGVTRTSFEVSIYDKLGRLVETRRPASTSQYQEGAGVVTVTQAQAGMVLAATEYNAFGEVTRKGTQGGRQEYFDYDNAGRLWRTNAGDGIDRIQLYDLQGSVTAEIRSAGSGRDNLDVKTFASAQAAAGNSSTRRVDIQHDLLGRVSSRTEAARQELQGGVAVQRQYTTANVLQSSVGMMSPLNKVALTWNSLAVLGSGDIRVSLEYRTPIVGDEGVETGGTLRSYTSGVLVGDANASGTTLQWDTGYFPDQGVGTVTRIVVCKKDRYGNWIVVVDQPPGQGANAVTVAAPPDPNSSVQLLLRAAGSAGDTGWWSAGLDAFGSALRFNAAGLAAGSYEYRVVVTPRNEAARIIATGTVAITMPPLNSISASLRYGQPLPPGVMTWASPSVPYVQAFRYRVNGSTGAWTTLPVTLPASNLSAVDTRGLAAATYQFELLWSLQGQNAPNEHATGTFTVSAPVPAYYVPPQNLPNIVGVTMGTGVYGGTLIGVSESGQAYYSGGTQVHALVWPAANANVVQYRAAGGAWINFAVDNAGQTMGESGPAGWQKALLQGIAPGSYEVRILAGSPPSAQATAILDIYPQSPGSYVNVSEQVPVSTPVVAYYTPVYETRTGVRTVQYQVWVNDPPIFLGYDEAGQPMYSYPRHQETRTGQESYTYQVQVGQTPVYARDESGNIIYQTSYVTQTQQQWVPGTTPNPTVRVTTPPYVPGYWVGEVPTRYSVAVTTAGSSSAISTGDGGVIAQAAGQNGDARWLRPVVQQKTDRWGNVTEITDPRAAAWKTSYRYNASNQLVVQVLPDAGKGAASTSVYYDALGRQVAVRDANGNVNGQVFDAGGNLVQEVHADGGVVTHSYNAFGDKVKTVDALGKTVSFSYDRMGCLLRMDKGVAVVWRAAGNSAQPVQTRMVSDAWTYDQLGRKLSQTNGNGEVLRYAYDLPGNLVATTQPLGQVVRAAYDAQGRQSAEADANGVASTWTYDYFGRLQGHVDKGGARYSYSYDNARQLTAQSSTRGQSIGYSYDAAGQVTQVRDGASDKTSTFVYDLAGRKLRERVVQGGITYQDNYLAYDARGLLRDVADGRARVSMEYDQVGNRTRVATSVDYQGVSGEVAAASDRYFKYDRMNRQVVVDGVDTAGNIGTQGHQIAYDKAGDRTSDTSWGSKVVTSGGEVVLTGFGEDGVAIYANTTVTYTATTGYSTEEYRYDQLNRLESVVRDKTQIDVRHYDAADRVVSSGPGWAMPVKYSEIINQGVAPEQLNGKETRLNRYDANGRLMHQTVLKSDNTLKLNISWDPSEAASDAGSTFYADGYDAVGNVLGYTVTNHEAGVINEYSTSLARFEGYQESVTRGQSTRQLPGTSTQQYDANGFLVGVVDSTQPANNRVFVNDASGKALFVNQAGRIQRQLVVDGEVLGLYGAGVNPSNPASGYGNDPNFANVVDFDFGYSRVSASYPAPSPGAYTVRTGDTLQSISQGAYGDSALWYRIAEANGLASNSDLRVGQTLNIPNRVSTISNNSTTFKPYDPSRIEGDKTPSLATPAPKKKKSGFLKKLLMAVVAIVVAYFTGYWYLNTFGSATVTGGAAAATTVSGSVAMEMTVAGTAAWTPGSLVTAGALGGAAGSSASQLVGVASGVQDRFDWKGVALSAIGGGIGMGLGGFNTPGVDFGAGQVGNRIVQAAVGNALTQGIGVVTGLQDRFDWRGVAASAVGSSVGQAVAPAFGGEFLGRLATGLVAGTAAAAARGGRVVVQQVAVDAFGNALGESIAEAASSGERPVMQAAQGDDAAYGSSQTAPPRPTLTFNQDAELRRAALDPYGWRFTDGGLPARVDPASTSLDLDQVYDRWSATGQKPVYDFGDPFQVGAEGHLAQVRVVRSEGLRPATVNGISVNSRAEALLNAAAEGDISGMGSLYRDYKLLGGLMNDAMQQKTLDDLKGQLRGRLGVMRNVPTEEALGAKVGMGAAGVARYDKADLIDRYADALRKVGLAQQGVIELDYTNFEIRTIGNAKLTPAQYLGEVEARYQRAFARGVELGEQGYARGELRYPVDMPKQLQVGLFADALGKRTLLTYNMALGVPEGPGQLTSLNRWTYDPQGTGLFIRNDVLVDLGPSQRYWIDGKSSLTEAQNSSRQFETFNRYTAAAGGKVATPQGLFDILPSGKIRR